MRIKEKNWDFNSMVTEFMERKYLLNMGSGKLSKRYSLERSIVKDARNEARNLINKNIPTKFPKILILDIETAPLKAYVWSKWKQNIYGEQLISDWFMLSWSAKWLFNAHTDSMGLNVVEAIEQDDKRIVIPLRELLNEADIVIAHNGKKFDIPKINARMLINGLNPPLSYQQIDTLLISRKEFGFTDNRLDALGKLFGLGEKINTSFELWSRCYSGDKQALIDMETYNRQDVILLEAVYLKIRPWIRSHPNIGLFLSEDSRVCPHCGSPVISTGSYYYTMTSKFKTYQCSNKSCMAISRGRESVYKKEKRKVLNVSLAR